MGGYAAKPKPPIIQGSATDEENGGIHFVEFHVPSASYGAGAFLLVGLLSVLSFLFLKQLCKSYRMRRNNPHLPTRQPARHMNYHEPIYDVVGPPNNLYPTVRYSKNKPDYPPSFPSITVNANTSGHMEEPPPGTAPNAPPRTEAGGDEHGRIFGNITK